MRFIFLLGAFLLIFNCAAAGNFVTYEEFGARGYKGITLLGNFIDDSKGRKKAAPGKYLPRPVQKVTVKNMKIASGRKYSLTQDKKTFKNTVLVRK